MSPEPSGSTLRDRARSFAKSILRPLLRFLPDRLLIGAVCRVFPRSAILEATTACNLDCPLCATHWIPRRERFLERGVVDRFLSSTRGSLRSVCFHLQGEPLVHPELFDFVEACSRRGVETSFGTNGMLLRRYADRIFESGLTEISIDLDGVEREDYERYRKGGDFEQVVRNVRELVASKRRRAAERPRIHVQTIMFSYNEDREAEVDRFLADFGADRVRKKRPSYFHDIERGKELGLEIRPDVQARADRAAAGFLAQVDTSAERRWSRANGADSLFRERRLCPQLRRATVLADGRVVACCMDALGTTEFGDLTREPFDRIWRGARHRRVLADFLRRRLPICKTCTLS